MPLPTIVLQMPPGSVVPTQIHLRDGTTIKPAANGTITVATNYLHDLLAAGWQIVISGGATHVP
jgi:hypothetical protein